MPKRGLKLVWNWSETPSNPPSQTHSPKWPFWDPSTQTNIWREKWTTLFYHTSLTGSKNLRSLNSPWGFRFPKRPFWKMPATNIGRGLSAPLFYHILSQYITLALRRISWRSLNFPWGFWCRKQPFWKSNARIICWKRAVHASIMSHFPSGEKLRFF